ATRSPGSQWRCFVFLVRYGPVPRLDEDRLSVSTQGHPMDKILDSLLDAANKHGKLQDLLREAWVRMAPNTRFGLLQGATVESMALSSAGKDFSQRKLVKALEAQMAK